MSVAATIMHCPEASKERVEGMTLGVTAMEIHHLTRSTFLLLLRIHRQACMLRNHVATLRPHFTSSRQPSTVDCSHRHVGTHLL